MSKVSLQRLEQILELAETLNHQNNFDETLRLVASRLCQLLDSELALIMMVNPRTQDTIKTIIREGVEVSHHAYRSAQNQISGWIMKQKDALLTPDIKTDSWFEHVRWLDLQILSVLGVPLQIEGSVIGSMILSTKVTNPHSMNLISLF